MTLEGIVGANAPTFIFDVNPFWDEGCAGAWPHGHGRGACVSFVKALGWYWATDGINAGRDAVITDSFFKVTQQGRTWRAPTPCTFH